MAPEAKRLRSVEGLIHCAELRQSHSPDTDSRLLTELKQWVWSRESRVYCFIRASQRVTALRDEGGRSPTAELSCRRRWAEDWRVFGTRGGGRHAGPALTDQLAKAGAGLGVGLGSGLLMRRFGFDHSRR